jgi:hypothetical protein
VHATRCLLKSSQHRATLRTTELRQPQPKNDGRGPHVRIQGENTLARAGHTLSRTTHHGCGLMLPDWRKPVTTMEGRMSRENYPKITNLAPKNITQKALPERIRRRHPKNVHSPQPTTCEVSVRKKKTKKESKTEKERKKLYSSKARRTTSHHR